MRPEFLTNDIEFLSRPENYGMFIGEVLSDLELEPVDLSEMFDISLKTARRHVEGQTMPRTPGIRKSVVKRLMGMLNELG